MDLRKAVTKAMPQVPKEKMYSSDYPFHYKDYADNLFCPLGKAAQDAYGNGSGNETQPTQKVQKDGSVITTPAKMASVASSSAMTFNLLGNDPAVILLNPWLPAGTYQVQYEKQMRTLDIRSNPANLDAFLSNEDEKTAIFCEMKLLEWLNKPGDLKERYGKRECYFTPDNSVVSFPIDAFGVFKKVIEEIEKAAFVHYDGWQMFKHLLAIYNHTSFTTQKAVEKLPQFPSVAGKYNRIILSNVVNEFPPERIADEKVRSQYLIALEQEREEAVRFVGIIHNSGIPRLYDNNCNAAIEVKYISAKTFADCLKITDKRRDYLTRYFT